LTDCILATNVASFGGGASGASLNNCKIMGNMAGSGGGTEWGSLTNCMLTGNRADYGGGANGGTLNNCAVTGNTAYYGGGADDSTLNNCAVTDNTAYYGGGAKGGHLANCTVTGNTAYNDGGGVHLTVANNCIVYYNNAPTGENYAQDEYHNLNYSCTTPIPTNGTGNIITEPSLASASHIGAESVCRGAGSSTFTNGMDIDGDAWLTPPSIGCDEYEAASLTGALTVGVAVHWTNVAVGFAVDFTGMIDGRVAFSVWDFGDGTVQTNRPYTSHRWMAPGDYVVALRACNGSNPTGVSATVMMRVLESPVHYVVAASKNPVPPYTNWATAASNIQDAVDAAFPGGMVLVTNGVYDTGGRAVYGQMTNRVVLHRALTVQSANGPEVTTIRGFQLPGIMNGDGAIRCAYLTNGAVLSGFTLASGATLQTNDYWNGRGGGVWCESESAVLTNCILTGNSGWEVGGGASGGTLNNCILTNNAASQPYYSFGGGAVGGVLNNCTLVGNVAWYGGGADGGTLNNCALSNNVGRYYGGGAWYSTLNQCTVTSNSSYCGGGTYHGTLNNCVLVGNFASSGGGAVAGILNSCTLVGNSAYNAGGGAASCMLNNCLVYHNLVTWNGSNCIECTNNYCCTTPLPADGVGNITNEPSFMDLVGGNLRLQSNSPCIDAGYNAYAVDSTDLEGNPRIARLRVDIGAYEFQGPGLRACLNSGLILL